MGRVEKELKLQKGMEFFEKLKKEFLNEKDILVVQQLIERYDIDNVIEKITIREEGYVDYTFKIYDDEISEGTYIELYNEFNDLDIDHTVIIIDLAVA